MKKISITLSALMLLATAVFIGCRKDASGLPQKNVGNVNKQSTSRMNTGTPGELHNYILGEYHRQYGFTTNNLTITQVRDVIKHCTEIAIAAEILDNTVNPDDYANDMIQEKIDLGLFDNNGIYKAIPTNLAIMETHITNASIRTAIHTINNYSGSHSGFIAFAQAEISGLQNLNPGEQEMLDGYMSILSSSFNYWDTHIQGLPTPTPGGNETRTRNVTMVDAMGYTNGLYDTNGGMDFRRALLFSDAMSACGLF
jgi:hypothetical protein